MQWRVFLLVAMWSCSVWGQCVVYDGCTETPFCCNAGLMCYEKDSGYSQCLPVGACEDKNAAEIEQWTCRPRGDPGDPCESVPSVTNAGDLSACVGTVSGGTCNLPCLSNYFKTADLYCSNGAWSAPTCSSSCTSGTLALFDPCTSPDKWNCCPSPSRCYEKGWDYRQCRPDGDCSGTGDTAGFSCKDMGLSRAQCSTDPVVANAASALSACNPTGHTGECALECQVGRYQDAPLLCDNGGWSTTQCLACEAQEQCLVSQPSVCLVALPTKLPCIDPRPGYHIVDGVATPCAPQAGCLVSMSVCSTVLSDLLACNATDHQHHLVGDVATACASQEGCVVSPPPNCSASGPFLPCEDPALGYYLSGDVALRCSEQLGCATARAFCAAGTAVLACQAPEESYWVDVSTDIVAACTACGVGFVEQRPCGQFADRECTPEPETTTGATTSSSSTTAASGTTSSTGEPETTTGATTPSSSTTAASGTTSSTGGTTSTPSGGATSTSTTTGGGTTSTTTTTGTTASSVGTGGALVSDASTDEEESATSPVLLIAILVAVVCLIIVVLVALVAFSKRGGQRKKNVPSNMDFFQDDENATVRVDTTANFSAVVNALLAESSTKQIGKGGCADVYAATMKDGEDVALKVLFKNATARDTAEFTHEASILGKLVANDPHEHVVGFRFFCQSPLVIALELCHGGSVMQAVADRSLASPDKRRICVQTAQGMEHLHVHGIAHNDLKPHNLLLTLNGDVRITDFGGASHQDMTSTQSLKSSAVFVGTVRYAAPERLMTMFFDAALSDVCSYAYTVYAILMDQQPFEGISNQDLEAQIKSGVGPDLSLDTQVIAEFPLVAAVFGKAACISPESRPSFHAIVQALAMASDYEDASLLLAGSTSGQSAQTDSVLSCGASMASVTSAPPSLGPV